MKALHPRHQAVADYYNTFHEQHGRRPTIRDACEALGYSSASAVVFALKQAEKHGVKVAGESRGHGFSLKDPDVAALQTCITAMEKCSPAGRRANLTYLLDRYGKT